MRKRRAKDRALENAYIAGVGRGRGRRGEKRRGHRARRGPGDGSVMEAKEEGAAEGQVR